MYGMTRWWAHIFTLQVSCHRWWRSPGIKVLSSGCVRPCFVHQVPKWRWSCYSYLVYGLQDLKCSWTKWVLKHTIPPQHKGRTWRELGLLPVTVRIRIFVHSHGILEVIGSPSSPSPMKNSISTLPNPSPPTHTQTSKLVISGHSGGWTEKDLHSI